MIVEESGLNIPQIPCARRCVAYGIGLSGGSVGNPLQFVLATVAENGARLKIGGAQVSVTIQSCKEEISTQNSLYDPESSVTIVSGQPGNSKVGICNVADKADGSYLISYTCKRPGNFSLNVRVSGEEVAGSPWTLKILPGIPVPSKSHLQTTQNIPQPGNLNPGLVVVDKPGPFAFTLSTRDVYGNFSYSPNVRVGARGGGGVKVGTVTDFQNSKFLVNCDISGDGRLDVLMDGQHVVGSPVQIEFRFLETPKEFPGSLPERVERAWLNRHQRVKEDEEDLSMAYRRLQRIKDEVDRKAQRTGFGMDMEKSVPPVGPVNMLTIGNSGSASVRDQLLDQPLRSSIKSEEISREDAKVAELEEKMSEMQTRFSSVLAKERQLEKILCDINEQKLREETKHGGSLFDRPSVEISRSSTDPDVPSRLNRPLQSDSHITHHFKSPNPNSVDLKTLKRTYFRKDGFLEDKKEELRKALIRRANEKSLGIDPPFDFAEAMKRSAFLKISRNTQVASLDAEGRVSYAVDSLFERFATSLEKGYAAFGMADGVKLSNMANLPVGDTEIVECYLEYLHSGNSGKSEFISKDNFLGFLGEISRLVYRKPNLPLHEALASLFENHLFAIAESRESLKDRIAVTHDLPMQKEIDDPDRNHAADLVGSKSPIPKSRRKIPTDYYPPIPSSPHASGHLPIVDMSL